MTGRRPIQIWSPDRDGWVRPPVGPYGDHYAGVPRLSLRSARPRLLLVGESVAAGYLYAPWYTPATALADRLTGWDVVDLARTNESAASLVETVEAAMQLEPDVVAVWAGNNWMLRDLAFLSPYHPDCPVRIAFGQLLRRDGLNGVAAFVERALVHHVWPQLEATGRLVRAAGARLVVVVPEVNLVDWTCHQPVPVLPDGAESAWHDASSRRQAAATDPAGGGLGRLRDEIAAACGPLRAVTASPMATRGAQNLLREWAASCGAAVVDVPELIAERGDRPDRRWFLDYCHHTSLGIDAVAGQVAATISDGEIAERQLPAGELEAVAALGAILHTDHRLISSQDRKPLLRHWLAIAEGAFDGTAELVADIVESRLARGPVPLSAAQRNNRMRPHPFGFAHGWRPYGLELDALETLGVAAEALARLRLPAERAWPPARALRPGRVHWLDEQPGATGRGFLRALWPTTDFATRVRPGQEIAVRLTARARTLGEATISLGDWTDAFPLDTSWTTHVFRVPPDAAAPGLRPLRIGWPSLAEGSERWQRALDALSADRRPELHPTFGEVHSLRVDDT